MTMHALAKDKMTKHNISSVSKHMLPFEAISGIIIIIKKKKLSSAVIIS